MSSLYDHAYAFRNFTSQIWNVFFPVKFIIKVYTQKFSIMDLLNRVTINFDTQVVVSLFF